MKNRVNAKIGNREYSLITEDNPAFLDKLCEYVNGMYLEQQRANPGASEVDTAIMTALSIAEEHKKASESAENMRVQFQGYLEELTKARTEIAELKRELQIYKR